MKAVSIAAAFALSIALRGCSAIGSLNPGPIQAFDLSDVILDQHTFQAKAFASNLDYLLQLDPDRMLYVFRTNAKVPDPPGLPFWGTWEGSKA